jgi:dTDP-4-amino-4,6-dideoxygalactose transaminase
MDHVLERGEFIFGPEVRAFEEKLAAHLSIEHVVSCASGSDALWLALIESGIGPGDAVFVPTFTFVATCGAVTRAGATPVFVDVEREGFCIGGETLEAAFSDFTSQNAQVGLRPAAVIGVDLFGHPCDYAAISAVADSHGLRLFADAAQSLGASRGNRMVGSLASCTTTSFFPSKPLLREMHERRFVRLLILRS